jgi:glutamate/tyrosine decarboxylase-like PLP-dependent enzyme
MPRQPTDEEMMRILKPIAERWAHALNLMMTAAEVRSDLPDDYREQCEVKLARRFAQELRRERVPEPAIEPMLNAIKATADEKKFHGPSGR